MALSRRDTEPAAAHIHYAWIVLGVTFICLLAAAAVRSLPGIILKPLEEEFGWTRGSISIAVSINLVLFGLAGPVLGRFMDVFGPRTVAITATVLIAVGAGSTLFMSQLWQMYFLWGVAVGAGSGGASMVLGSVVINRWFHERRGFALGVLGAAMSAGQLVLTPVMMQLTTAYGWRTAALFISLVIALFVLPLVYAGLWNDPAVKRLTPYGMTKGMADVLEPDSHPMGAALKNVDFWLLALSFGICGLTTSGLFQTHLIPHGIDHGFSEMTMAVSLGLMGATDIVGAITAGWICDRFGKRHPLAFFYLLRGVSLLAFPAVDSTGALMGFSALYGLNWLSTVPATSALAADLFGKRNIGAVFGWIFFSHQLGAALASFGAGFMFERFGDYTLAFTFAGLCALIACIIVLNVRA